MTKLTLKKIETMTDAELDAALDAGVEGASELSINSEVRADEGHALMTRPMTVDTIREGITSAMDHLAHTFYELEPRIIGTNGRHYRVDATLPAGCEDTGETINVNAYRYMQQQITSVICWKLEDMLARCSERVEDQKRQITQAVRQLSTGRVEESFVEAKADFLETLQVQQVLLAHAFEASQEAHLELIGEDYETKAMRQARTATTLAKPKSDLESRLAKLGVKS